jgi:hypothetical protein
MKSNTISSFSVLSALNASHCFCSVFLLCVYCIYITDCLRIAQVMVRDLLVDSPQSLVLFSYIVYTDFLHPIIKVIFSTLNFSVTHLEEAVFQFLVMVWCLWYGCHNYILHRSTKLNLPPTRYQENTRTRKTTNQKKCPLAFFYEEKTSSVV